MAPTPEEIHASLLIPVEIANGAIADMTNQREARGQWPDQWLTEMGETADPPWPAPGDAQMTYLLYFFQASVDAGTPLNEAAVHLALSAWRSGGVVNYDRGQRDARAELGRGAAE